MPIIYKIKQIMATTTAIIANDTETTTCSLRKIIEAWKTLYESLKQENDRLRAENEELRRDLRNAQNNIERLSAMRNWEQF